MKLVHFYHLLDHLPILYHTVVVHKIITGSFSFFNQSVKKNIGALNFHRTSTNSNKVYDVISRSFTPNQRHIIETRCTANISQFNEIYTWLREQNPTFAAMPEISDCPSSCFNYVTKDFYNHKK